jgi:hypothetical protein
MQGRSTRSRYSGRIVVSLGLAAALLLASCGSGKSTGGASGSSAPSTTQAKLPESTTLGQGVTATTVKLGVVMVDYKSIGAFIDFTRGNQQQAYQVLIDNINKNGGVDGRQIVPVYQTFVPIGTAGPTAACTALTEDSKVFATIGVLIDTTGASQLCFAKQHQSILITHELSESTIDQAPPGLLLTPDITAERLVRAQIALLGKKGLLKGKKVAILAETSTKDRIASSIKPAFDALKVPEGTAAVLATGGNPDTTAAQQALQSFIERWKGEGVNAVFISGLDTVSKVFVQELTAGMPGVMLMTDADSSAQGAGQDAVHAGVHPNPYEGMYSLVGRNDQSTFETPDVQKCVKIYEAATGVTVISPNDLKPGKDGKRDEVYQTVEDACGDLTFFKVIADKVGKYLDNTNWTNTVNSFGEIGPQLMSQPFGSLGQGKYDSDDGFSLVSFDSSIGDGGDWKTLTPFSDVTKP